VNPGDGRGVSGWLGVGDAPKIFFYCSRCGSSTSTAFGSDTEHPNALVLLVRFLPPSVRLSATLEVL